MKRIIVKMSLMVVAVITVAVAANAQASQQYRAEIPFSFDAAGKHNVAGTYIVGPLSGALAIRNIRDGKTRMLGMIQEAGDNNWDRPGKLTFLKSNGSYTLTEVSTATFKVKMKHTRTAVKDVAGNKPAVDIVTIYLN